MIEEIKGIWEDYRSSLVRVDELRDILRIKMADAVASGISQSEIAREIGLPRQAVQRYLQWRR